MPLCIFHQLKNINDDNNDDIDIEERLHNLWEQIQTQQD